MRAFSCYMKGLVVTLITIQHCSAGRMDCLQIKHRCRERVACGMAWHNYQVHCQGIVDGDVDTCTISCRRAITVLLSSVDGTGRLFRNCSCTGEEVCKEQQRLNFCSQFVMCGLETLDDSKVVDCNSARIMCEADAACHTAFQMYISQCQSAINGLNCTRECESSLHRLYKQKRAAKLKKCVCNEDYVECKNIHRNAETICKDHNDTYKLVHNSGGNAHVRMNNLVWISFALTVYLK